MSTTTTKTAYLMVVVRPRSFVKRSFYLYRSMYLAGSRRAGSTMKPSDRPVHDLFGRDPGDEVPTNAHAEALRAFVAMRTFGTALGTSRRNPEGVERVGLQIPPTKCAFEKAGLSYYDL